MTRHEANRLEHLERGLTALGFTSEQIRKLRRASNTLSHWYEAECNGEISRDQVSEISYRYNTFSAKRIRREPDRENGALKTIQEIVGSVPATKVSGYYIQTDPRGAALYILRPGDVPEGIEVDTCYSRGICVY